MAVKLNAECSEVHLGPCQAFITTYKVSKYGVISGPYFPVFGLNTERYVFSSNTGKYGPEITPYLDTFHAVHAKFFEEIFNNFLVLTTFVKRCQMFERVLNMLLIFSQNNSDCKKK